MTNPLSDRILQVASELFYSQGIKATGVDAIVKAAGTTKMSLYKYFPSKDDLVLAHLSKNADALHTKFFANLKQQTLEPKAQLLTIFDAFNDILNSPEFRGCPFINAAAEFAVEENPVQQASAKFYEAFRNELTAIAQAANLRQPERLAWQLSMLITGALVNEQLKRGSGAMATAREAAEWLIRHHELG